jgi:hypothetical protein
MQKLRQKGCCGRSREPTVLVMDRRALQTAGLSHANSSFQSKVWLGATRQSRRFSFTWTGGSAVSDALAWFGNTRMTVALRRKAIARQRTSAARSCPSGYLRPVSARLLPARLVAPFIPFRFFSPTP